MGWFRTLISKWEPLPRRTTVIVSIAVMLAIVWQVTQHLWLMGLPMLSRHVLYGAVNVLLILFVSGLAATYCRDAERQRHRATRLADAMMKTSLVLVKQTDPMGSFTASAKLIRTQLSSREEGDLRALLDDMVMRAEILEDSVKHAASLVDTALAGEHGKGEREVDQADLLDALGG